ncbi:MAG: MauE/DoxX family redox-associated membrane protein [Solirubrobacterales bacterium]
MAAGAVELTVGLLCLLALFSFVPLRPVALVCAALYGFFAAILFSAVRRRSSFSCNCFGASHQSPVSRNHVVRAAVLSAMSLMVAIVSTNTEEFQLGYAFALFVPIAAVAVLATQLLALVPRGSLESHNIRGGE